MYYYEVAPTKVVRATQTTYTYHSTTAVQLGSLVTVSMGKRELVGIVLHETSRPAYTTKPLHALDLPPLPSELLATAQWIAEYYATHIATVLQTILPRGLTTKRRRTPVSKIIPSRDRTNFLLNKDQASAVKTLLSMSPGTAILHGITGSGKTAVYIELVRDCIAQGKSAIVLVPEIALTSQLVAEFCNHFDTVHVTHSNQTEAARHLLWEDILRSTKPLVVIGPRSALFAPVEKLGIVIIDEAHEPTYRQDQSPKYSALRVASILALHHTCRVVQGTATPLVSEYYLATSSKRPIVSLPARARSQTIEPTITTVDMTKRQHGRHKFLSDILQSHISTTLADGKQVLIFHNRRGSASTTLCENCGWSALCERCMVPFTLHADAHKLLCHICANSMRVPTSCPECGHTGIIHKGIGTKLIEAELRKLYPHATIARFDGDTTKDLTLENNYQAIYDGEIDIIIGTQVIAKGLDLPHLRTVGVIQADAGLALPDYTASERTFQLLSQVIGRVGRSAHQTSVVVQTYQPQAPAITLGITQNFMGFYHHTLEDRRRSLFPPFTFLLKLTCVYKTEATAIANARTLAATLRRLYPSLTILGPTPAFYEYQHQTYRWQLILKSSSRRTLVEVLAHVPPTHWQVDIDPYSLL
jgi:primosomal protein N' (replication factor Y)